MIAVGVSAGGFATVALTADPPPGLVAAISFAGGRGSQESRSGLPAGPFDRSFRSFGKRSRVPMLWVYAANDHFFGPALARQFADAFKSGGGNIDFVAAPAFGTDGHGLFSPAGIPIWSGYVDEFLKAHNLVMRDPPMPLPPPAIAAPARFSANARKAFETYLIDAPHKAFAFAPDGHFGWKSGSRTVETARSAALKFCEQGGAHCEVMFVDDAAVGH